MSPTIILRVVNSLRAHGNNAEADELIEFVNEIRQQTEHLFAIMDHGNDLMKTYVNTVQERCPHYEWYLTEKEPEVSCINCGHTVCDARAWAFGMRVKQGDFAVHSRRGGKRFTMSPFLKHTLAAMLKVMPRPRKPESKPENTHADKEGL